MANSSSQQSVDSLSTLSEQLKEYFSTLDEKFDSIILENVENYYQQVMEILTVSKRILDLNISLKFVAMIYCDNVKLRKKENQNEFSTCNS